MYYKWRIDYESFGAGPMPTNADEIIDALNAECIRRAAESGIDEDDVDVRDEDIVEAMRDISEQVWEDYWCGTKFGPRPIEED